MAMKSNDLHVGSVGESGRLKPTGPRAWAPAVGMAVLIFLASSAPATDLPGGLPPGTDKLIHAFVYAVLGGLIARALWWRSQRPAALQLAGAAALLATLYGVTDEVHQLFVPGRHFEIADLIADAAGGLLGAALTIGVFRRRASQRPLGDQPGS